MKTEDAAKAVKPFPNTNRRPWLIRCLGFVVGYAATEAHAYAGCRQLQERGLMAAEVVDVSAAMRNPPQWWRPEYGMGA